MEFVTLERSGATAILTLSRGKANAINSAMLDEIHDAFREIEKDDSSRAVVLASASEKFFSSGFDVSEVFAYDRAAMGDFFGRFMDLYHYIVRFPKPTVAAVPGHAYAAGTILALACDVRIFAEGTYGFALNEINIGIVIPPGVFQLAVNASDIGTARVFLLGGENMSPEDAASLGVAHDLAEHADVLEVSLEHAEELATKPAGAIGLLKRVMGDCTGFPSEVIDRDFLETFLDQWFSDECVAARQELTGSVKK